jgi:hypothetical protein
MQELATEHLADVPVAQHFANVFDVTSVDPEPQFCADAIELVRSQCRHEKVLKEAYHCHWGKHSTL